MRTVTKRQLARHTAKTLDAVAVDQPVFVTEGGLVRWVIEAVVSPTDEEPLRAPLRITPAKRHPAPWLILESRFTPAQVEALFAER